MNLFDSTYASFFRPASAWVPLHTYHERGDGCSERSVHRGLRGGHRPALPVFAQRESSKAAQTRPGERNERVQIEVSYISRP